MKPLLTLLKIALVGIFWSVFFIEGIRVIMLSNWYFDIFRPSHWLHAWNLWQSGWIIDEPKEWAFILIVFSFVPVWLTVWITLSKINWGGILLFLSKLPLKIVNKLFEKQIKKLSNSASVKVVKKKKSYKEIRPKNLSGALESPTVRQTSGFDKKATPSISAPQPSSSFTATPQSQPSPAKPAEFSHSLFNMEEDNLIDFDLFNEKEEEIKQTPKDFSEKNKKNIQPSQKKKFPEKAQPQKSRSGDANSSFEVIKQKGYDIISGATIDNTFIDFVGVSKDTICICLNDKEPGDWLADEERFNDEEPLWFSESSHRISPVRKISLARDALEEKLKKADLSFTVIPFVIEQIGNIINAEDMLDIWNDLNVNVTRIDRGSPREIPLFAKTLEKAGDSVDKNILEKIRKLLRNNS